MCTGLGGGWVWGVWTAKRLRILGPVWMQAAGRVTVREGRRRSCLGGCCKPRGPPLTPAFLAIVQNRELQIMKMLDHGNVTTLHHYFYTEGEKVKRCPRTLPELPSACSASLPCASSSPCRPTVCTGSFCASQPDETYLNLVMDFIPQTVYGMSRHYAKAKKTFPLLYMKVWPPKPAATRPYTGAFSLF